MKKQNDLTVGGALFFTAIFACMGIYSLTIDSNNPVVYIPLVGVIVGIIMAFNAKNKADEKKARKEQQDKFAQTIDYDDCYGNGDLKLYFNSKKQEVTICATTDVGTDTQVVRGFLLTKTVKTDDYIVSFDATHNKILRIKNNKGTVAYKEYDFTNALKNMGITTKDSTPAVKAYNNYAFITDDANELVVTVTPFSMHMHRYSDIVSISYEENGNDMFNKSLGGAVVGGLLFGGVGAIVGSNTAKTTKNKRIEKMTIKILLKSTSDSNILLSIYRAGTDGAILETKNDADRAFYEGLLKEVSAIKDIFSIIIDMVDKNKTKQSHKTSQSLPTGSIADELLKLAQLRDSGILSEEEFQQQKTKLLK